MIAPTTGTAYRERIAIAQPIARNGRRMRPAATASAVAPSQRATKPAGQDQVCAIRQSIAAEAIARTGSRRASTWRNPTRVPGRRADMLATEATPVQRNPGAILTRLVIHHAQAPG